MTLKKISYHAFLLRLWKAGDEDLPEWRFSLEDPTTGDLRGFRQISELVDFLIKLMCRGDIQQDPKETGGPNGRSISNQ